MNMLRLVRFVLFIALPLTISLVGVGQQKQSPCTKSAKYEYHNSIDPEPLIVSRVKGQVTDNESVPIPDACLSIFTDKQHKLFATTKSDSKGNYHFTQIPAGTYRLVVSYDGFCTANQKIVILAKPLSKRRRRNLYAHMKTRAIDTCNYISSHMRPEVENRIR